MSENIEVITSIHRCIMLINTNILNIPTYTAIPNG